MSHYVFSFILFSFICKVWMLYKKKIEKWGRGVNCEEEMREKNELGEGGCVCVVGEKKKERQGGYMGGGEKKKGNGEWGLGVQCEKRGSGKERRKKKLKGKKLNRFYLYVHFVWYKVYNCENLFR